MSADGVGNDAAGKSRCGSLRRVIYIPLGGINPVLPSPRVGVYGLLHRLWVTRSRKLVVGQTPFVQEVCQPRLKPHLPRQRQDQNLYFTRFWSNSVVLVLKRRYVWALPVSISSYPASSLLSSPWLIWFGQSMVGVSFLDPSRFQWLHHGSHLFSWQACASGRFFC